MRSFDFSLARRLPSAILGLGAALLPSLSGLGAAHAYGSLTAIDVNHFRVAPGDRKLVGVERADVGRHLTVVPQAFVQYTDLLVPLCLGDTCPYAALVEHRVSVEASVSVALRDRVQLSLMVPATFYQRGLSVAIPEETARTYGDSLTPVAPAGLEDIRLAAKVAIYNRSLGGIGLDGTLTLPSGDGNSMLGTKLPSFTPRLLGHLHSGRLTGALNVGWQFAETVDILNIRSGMAFVFGLGAQVDLIRDPGASFSLVAEFFGRVNPRADRDTDIPLEFLVAAKSQVRRFGLFCGAGSRLYPGYGAPTVRIIAGLSYTWERPTPPTARYRVEAGGGR